MIISPIRSYVFVVFTHSLIYGFTILRFNGINGPNEPNDLNGPNGLNDPNGT